MCGVCGKEFWQLLVLIFYFSQLISPKHNPYGCPTHWHIPVQSISVTIILSLPSCDLAESPVLGMRPQSCVSKCKNNDLLSMCPNLAVAPIDKNLRVTPALRAPSSPCRTSFLELSISDPELGKNLNHWLLLKPSDANQDPWHGISAFPLSVDFGKGSMLSKFSLVLTASNFFWSSEFSFILLFCQQDHAFCSYIFVKGPGYFGSCHSSLGWSLVHWPFMGSGLEIWYWDWRFVQYVNQELENLLTYPSPCF